jgi:CspA family cold shock protein
MSNTMQGTVKFFSEDRGFGFIAREGGDDIFVHRTNLIGEGHITLSEGQSVEFEIGPGRKGDQAINVKPL